MTSHWAENKFNVYIIGTVTDSVSPYAVLFMWSKVVSSESRRNFGFTVSVFRIARFAKTHVGVLFSDKLLGAWS